MAGSGARRLAPIALACLLALLGFAASARAATLTVAWDASPDQTVVGYRVFVGTQSGSYSQIFDVGSATSFSYTANEGQRYYFAVAAYSPGPIVGPLSDEVSAAAGPVPGSAHPQLPSDPSGFWSSVWRADPVATRLSVSGPAACVEHPACRVTQVVVHGDEPISSLAITSDGRLFYVESAQRVRLVTPWGPAADAIVTAPAGVKLTQVAADPGDPNILWIGETATRADGGREFRIGRYQLTEYRAVPREQPWLSIALPAGGDPVFTIDASRTLYVAVPGEDRGMVFRAAPVDANGEPVLTAAFIAGYSRPTGILADAAGGRLWLSGFDGRHTPGTTTMTLADPEVSRSVFQSARTAMTLVYGLEGKYLVTLNADGEIEWSQLASNGDVSGRQAVPLRLTGAGIALSASVHGDVYVAVRTPDRSGSTRFTILRLIERR